ncbi:MAG: flavin reductase (DIM6/NTAB) family NADH-FMN oxidoreductase RutF [Myxococcota bacterium]|jgi:flavin reductase (DIM6/NTAB) family NADH-FMN oxidoreductase RutF
MQLKQDFKNALASWASGVSVVTTSNNGMLYGLTVSSFTSLSLDPALVLVCVDNRNRFPAMVEESEGFAVSILCREQEAASNYFASSGRLPTPNFTQIEGEWTEAGQPVVKGAAAHIVCRLHELLPRGDHTIVIGEVVEARHDPELEPLLYWKRSYRSIGE